MMVLAKNNSMVCANPKKIRFSLVGAALVLACAAARSAPVEDCMTRADVATMRHNFLETFPSRSAFDNYVDKSDFRLRTNVIEGAELQRGGKSSAEKVDWLMDAFINHKLIFADIQFIHSGFTFIKGQLHGAEPSVDNITTTEHFPKGECVNEAAFRAIGKECVMSQRLHNLAFTFVKEQRRLLLRSVDMFFEACGEKRSGG